MTFDKVVNRNETLSLKWDDMGARFGAEDLLPMWVADMDFRPPAAVLEALSNRVTHGVFGYTLIPDSVNEAIQQWVKKKHNWTIDSSWIQYSHGVVPSLALTIEAFTSPGDAILIQAPIYPPFFGTIEANGREVVYSQLLLQNNRYEIDFADFEKKIKNVTMFILCNPHNPSGRLWAKEELIKMAELCKKYNVTLISDDIHADLITTEKKYIPLVSLDPSYEDFVVTLIAPTKTFNLAGLQASSIITPNKVLRDKIGNVQARQGFHTLTTFGIIGMEAAYRHGENWLNDVMAYIQKNIETVTSYIEENIPALKVMVPESTYLIWIDCSGTDLSDDAIQKCLIEKGKLALEPGPKYGPGGEGFVRMNIACSEATLLDGLSRLKKALA